MKFIQKVTSEIKRNRSRLVEKKVFDDFKFSGYTSSSGLPVVFLVTCEVISPSRATSIATNCLRVKLRYAHKRTIIALYLLYLDIYISLLAVHTTQKRFQCERPREKRAERKEALGSPVNKVDRVEGRSWFQSEGPMIAKARV